MTKREALIVSLEKTEKMIGWDSNTDSPAFRVGFNEGWKARKLSLSDLIETAKRLTKHIDQQFGDYEKSPTAKLSRDLEIVMSTLEAACEKDCNFDYDRDDVDLPTSSNCVLCNEPVWEVSDLAEFEKNGAHVKCAEKELTGEVISLCKCAVWLRTDISICPRCEKPYFADGRTIAGRHA